jgi:hypothetical protein
MNASKPAEAIRPIQLVRILFVLTKYSFLSVVVFLAIFNTAKGQESGGATVQSDALYTLYVMNTASNPELQTLVKVRRHRKVTFQFFHASNGLLTLRGWPGKRKNRRFYLSDNVLLHQSPDNKIDTSIKRLDVHLGNLEINKSAVKILRSIINDSSKSYILFVPRVAKDASTGLAYVFYDIVPSSSNTTPDILLYSKIAVKANPSPPFSSY